MCWELGRRGGSHLATKVTALQPPGTFASVLECAIGSSLYTTISATVTNMAVKMRAFGCRNQLGNPGSFSSVFWRVKERFLPSTTTAVCLDFLSSSELQNFAHARHLSNILGH